MKAKAFNRLLSLVMALAMLIALAIPASAVDDNSIKFEKVDNSTVSASVSEREPIEETEEAAAPYADTDVVRVSIVLEEPSTIEAGYSTIDIASNASAMAYRAQLETEQASVTSSIENAIGNDLDVVWNLTLAANIISANVEYGQIEEIMDTQGVADVVIETQYEPAVVDVDSTANPNMATSSSMIGSSAAYLEGYTGAGSRIAIIDTGTDTDHQSFDAGAYEYALAQLAEEAGMSYEDYVASLDLLDADEIASVADELNVSIDPETAYLTSKLPYAYNYVDGDYDITHDNDSQGEHGSHVAGIATANSYIPDGNGGYVSALESVHVQGVAPEAQLITMKVFGKGGGAYDSDYMAAIEDAIILGADTINLSLGSGNAGLSYSSTEEYQDIMESLANSDTVVTMSAGNAGSWAENDAVAGYPYADEVNYDTVGSPGSFTNSLSVASADNTGATGAYVSVDGQVIVYTETTGYRNQPMTSLAGEHDYVLFDFDRAGNEAADFAAYADALAGKIVVCYRGTSSFYEKGNAAVANGAIGVIIANNTTGTISMDLSDYTGPAPCVSITQAAGETLKEAATAVTDDEGNVLYYEGTMTVSDSIGSSNDPDADITMSDFSSWGVPGSLTMKPEITAPGGNIYSVNGLPAGGTSYEQMSGTSMAAPQVTGMAALVAQYIRENDLAAQTGLSPRVLAQSLLMSTAVPLREAASGYEYYSVLNQGAGLANVGDAVTATSYILMDSNATDSYADGKVKAELGDDPDKTGSYSFSFTINNLNGEDEMYALSADLFTQALYNNGSYDFLSDYTTGLAFTASWTVDGAPVDMSADGSLDGMDFNGDGQVTLDDGQALLDYATGARESITNEALADLNNDGLINSYDAYLFFNTASTGYVTVPADGSVNVGVTLTLTDAQKAALEESNPKGAYIEGFVYATAASSEEGVLGTSHSIPVLGYYGSWTDPSMFDVGTWTYNSNADEADIRPSHLGSTYSNYVTIRYLGDSSLYYFGGNPMFAETYDETRNAMNSQDTLASAYFALIRNAAGGMVTVTNTTTGEVEFQQNIGTSYGAYFYENAGAWYNTSASSSLNFSPAGNEGDNYELTLTMAPEYYLNDDGTIDWDALGEGASLSIPFTIDNTAPEVLNVNSNIFIGGEGLTFTAVDNQYIAGVALYSADGTRPIWSAAGTQTAAGEQQTFTIDSANLDQGIYLLQVVDYANNVSTYRVFKDIAATNEVESVTLSQDTMTLMRGTTGSLTATVLPVNVSDDSVTWSSSDDAVATVNENGVVTAVDVGECTITATSVLDPEMSASCAVTVRVPDVTLTGGLQDTDGNPLLFTWDMKNDSTWTSYASLDNSINSMAQDAYTGSVYQQDNSGYMHKIDLTTGATLETSPATTAYGAPMQDLAVGAMTGTVFGVYGTTLLYSTDAMSNTFNYGWNLSLYLMFYSGATKFVAVTWAGYEANGDGTYSDVMLALDDAGTFWTITYDGSDSVSFGYIGSDLDLTFPTYAGTQNCSLVMSSDNTSVFYLSYFTGSTNEIYMLELTRSGIESTLLGNVGSDVWPAALISAESSSASGNGSTDVMSLVSPAVASATMVETAQAEAVTAGTEAASGSLNSVDTTAEADTQSVVDRNGDTVTVSVTEDVDSTNGVVEISYDPTALELANVSISGNYTSQVVDEATGTVTVGYVSLGGITAGSSVATLQFNRLACGVDTDVTILHKEVNDTTPNTEEVQTIALEHTYGEPTFVWSEDFSSCTAYFTCGVCGHVETVAATVTSETTDATCNDQGAIVYTATVEFEGQTYTDQKTVSTDPTGHTYGEPEFVWDAEGNCYAVFTCVNGDDTQVVPCTVTSETTPATATEDGKIVYTATVEFGGQTYTSTYEVVLPATGSGSGTGTGSGSGTGTGTGTGSGSGTSTGTDSVKTGDTAPYIVVAIVGVLAVIALAVLVFFQVRKRRG